MNGVEHYGIAVPAGPIAHTWREFSMHLATKVVLAPLRLRHAVAMLMCDRRFPAEQLFATADALREGAREAAAVGRRGFAEDLTFLANELTNAGNERAGGGRHH